MADLFLTTGLPSAYKNTAVCLAYFQVGAILMFAHHDAVHNAHFCEDSDWQGHHP